MPALSDRLHKLGAEVARIHALLRGATETSPLTRDELRRFVAPEGFPLQALRAHRSGQSPVLRHALRSALALGSAYFIALALPWSSHPHWLVLSVAVVLRGNLEQTLSRRNARVLGTLLGCAVVVALSWGLAAAWLQLAFLIAVAVAHAFVLQRYWLTATAATVMALLQSHSVDPAAGFAIGERVADTLLGALLAWGFSYVLPSWERRQLPQAISTVLKALADYAGLALSLNVVGAIDAVELRFARRRAYDALGALAAAIQRSAAEPKAVQLPVQELAVLLDHGQRLMAHLSMVRLTLATHRTDLSGLGGALADTHAVLATALAAPADPKAGAAACPRRPDRPTLPTCRVCRWSRPLNRSCRGCNAACKCCGTTRSAFAARPSRRAQRGRGASVSVGAAHGGPIRSSRFPVRSKGVPMSPLFSRRVVAALAGTAIAFTFGLASSAAFAQAKVRVASKIDTEGSLLGQVVIQVLEAGGIQTENKLQLGNTKIVRTAIAAGEIDLYPEYTGNGAFFFADEKNPAWKDAKAGFEKVKALDFEKNKIVWLEPSPANNTWAIAIRKDVAAANKLVSLQDLGQWVSGGGKFKLAASAEFIERPDALPAFQSAYGFKLSQDQLLTLAGGDTAVTIKAAAEQTSGVNGAMAYGTDGPVAALGLVILDDPKGVQPIYAPAPIVRAEVLARHPKIKDLLAPVFKALDGTTLQSLNAKIALEGQDAKQVAAAWLKGKGFVK